MDEIKKFVFNDVEYIRSNGVLLAKSSISSLNNKPTWVVLASKTKVNLPPNTAQPFWLQKGDVLLTRDSIYAVHSIEQYDEKEPVILVNTYSKVKHLLEFIFVDGKNYVNKGSVERRTNAYLSRQVVEIIEQENVGNYIYKKIISREEPSDKVLR